MDHDEAIYKIKGRIKDSQEELIRAGYRHTADYDCEELTIAIAAIEKQKTIKVNDSNMCTVCGAAIGIFSVNNYCKICGQRLE